MPCQSICNPSGIEKPGTERAPMLMRRLQSANSISSSFNAPNLISRRNPNRSVERPLECRKYFNLCQTGFRSLNGIIRTRWRGILADFPATHRQIRFTSNFWEVRLHPDNRVQAPDTLQTHRHSLANQIRSGAFQAWLVCPIVSQIWEPYSR